MPRKKKQPKFIRKTKVRLINVYTSNKTKGKVLELMAKYHVSTSTIIDKACEQIYPADVFTKIRHDKEQQFRAHYKPKWITEHPLATSQEETAYCSNALYIAINHFEPLKEILGNEKLDTNKIYNQFLAELNKCRDVYWDYNAVLRTRARAEKEIQRQNTKAKENKQNGNS